MLDTITRGYRFRKIVAVIRAIVSVVAVKARPSRPARTMNGTAIARPTAESGITPGTMPRSCADTAFAYVQARNPNTSTAATIESRRAASRARSTSSPFVRIERKTAPCSVKSASDVRPAKSE